MPKATRKTHSCAKGFIKRASYVRQTKKGKRIAVTERCIRDIGLPGKGFQGKGKGIGPLRKGELSKFGYENITKLSAAERQSALSKAVAEYGSLSVWRKLNAVQVYTRRTSPESSRLFKADMDWIRKTFGIKAV